MLLGENYHGFVKDLHIVQRAFLCALPFIVNYRSLREIVIFVSALNDAQGKVNVFTIHKKSFIQQAYFIEHFLSQQHKCTGQNLHFVNFIFIQIGEVIFSKFS